MGHQIHLTLREREDIMLMRRDGRGVSEIARAIGRSKSMVSREGNVKFFAHFES